MSRAFFFGGLKRSLGGASRLGGIRMKSKRQALLLHEYEIKGSKVPSGTIVEVAAGYLRNYLFPRNIAVLATKKNLALYEAGKFSQHTLRATPQNTFQPVHTQKHDVELLFHRMANPMKTKYNYRGPVNRWKPYKQGDRRPNDFYSY